MYVGYIHFSFFLYCINYVLNSFGVLAWLDIINRLTVVFFVVKVMLEVGDGPYPVDARFLTEINGLKIPAEFDCNIFYRPDQFFTGNPLKRLQAKLPGTEERMVANNSTFWGNHNYFTEVQSRFHACWLHLADLNSGMTVMRPMLPIVDDEYNEQIAVYQSVLRAKNKYVIAELGARWGTWGEYPRFFFSGVLVQ